MGRAEGLAAGLSAVSVTCEQVLIAYVWDPSTSVDIEEYFGVTREAVLKSSAGWAYRYRGRRCRPGRFRVARGCTSPTTR